MDSENSVVTKWNEFKALVQDLELDVQKNARGTAAAGVRARKGLRDLKSKAAELVKMTVDLDKSKKAAKPKLSDAEKAAKKAAKAKA